MNYQGPGIYRHRKGGLYMVLGLSLREATAPKQGGEDNSITDVVYYPMTTPSFLDDRKEDFWSRPLNDKDGKDPFNTPGRFTRERCAQCGNDSDLVPAGGGMVVCPVCGSNSGVSVG